MPASSERRVARGLAPRAPKPIAAAATKVEVAPSKAVKVDKEPKADAHALLGDVAKFAASLGLGGAAASGGGDFSDFAPGLAARRLSGAKASTREAKDATEPKESKPAKGERKGGKKDAADGGAARMGKGADADGAPEGTGGKPAGARPVDKRVKERGWNTGIEPRPGGNHPLLAGAGGDKSLLGRDESIWWKALDALPPLVGDPAAPSGGDADLDRCEILRQEGEKLVEAESAVFERDLAKRAAADYKWLQQVKRGGTTADKVAAMTLQIRESVIANLKALDTLLSWVTKRKGGKEVVRQAIEALQELFLTCLLPSRRMKFLEQQPVHLLQAESKDGRKRLLLWYIEDSVKRRYSIFVGALEECSRADLEFLKERATKACYECLVAKPEAEAKLLSTLVNKLGDPSRKVASKAGYLMSQLLLQHPAMKPIVVREVERFLFRPGLQERARYYGIVFLNQLVLSHKESEGGGGLALKLVELYFTMFRLVIQGHYGRAGEARKAQDEKYKTELRKFRKQQAKAQDKASSSGTRAPPDKKPPRAPHRASAEEMDARMLGALITGVRRAFPYVPENKGPLVSG
ncbi:hypothetical protein FOA52_004516 [Chlamydomonas sp. UWO 241]|nr:hypothetical protein FOA52_004516 [Chlamydomonas sp. UWO 241]